MSDEMPQYRKHAYPLLDDRSEILRETLKELVEKGSTVSARTPVAARVFFMWKKDGSLRLMIDYGPVNRITTENHCAMPKIHDIINAEQGKMVTKLDLHEGYY